MIKKLECQQNMIISRLRQENPNISEGDFFTKVRVAVDKIREQLGREEIEETIYGGLRVGLTPADRYRQIIGAVTNLDLNDDDSFGDGDQGFVDDESATHGPVNNTPGQALRDIWVSVKLQTPNLVFCIPQNLLPFPLTD